MIFFPDDNTNEEKYIDEAGGPLYILNKSFYYLCMVKTEIEPTVEISGLQTFFYEQFKKSPSN